MNTQNEKPAIERVIAIHNLLDAFGLDPSKLSINESVSIMIEIKGTILNLMMDNPDMGDKLAGGGD
jgi:hypothetical protein